MFTIYHKTKQEINMEEEIQEAQNIRKKKVICPTYIRRTNGSRINTYDLTEEEIIFLIEEDFLDWLNPMGNYAKFRVAGMKSTYELAKYLNPTFTPSYQMIVSFLEMQDKYPLKMVNDIMLKFGCAEKIKKAVIIASYCKETNEDFSEVTSEDIREVLNQLAKNEVAKQLTLKNKKNKI